MMGVSLIVDGVQNLCTVVYAAVFVKDVKTPCTTLWTKPPPSRRPARSSARTTPGPGPTKAEGTVKR